MTTPRGGGVTRLATPTVPNLTAEIGVGAGPSPETMWQAWRGDQEGIVPVRDLIKMRRESGQARALMRLITLPARASLSEAGWVERDGDSAEEETSFLNSVFELPPEGGGMTTSFSKFLRQALLCVTDGFSCFEKVFWVPPKGVLAGKATLRKLAYRNPETIIFKGDENGGFDGVQQKGNISGRYVDVVIPKEKVIYFAANEEENPMYGHSYFNAAWFHWDKAVKFYYLQFMRGKVAATGVRIGEEPPGATDPQKDQFRKTIAHLGVDTAMTVPQGWNLKFEAPGGNFNYQEAINHQLQQMSKSVLASFLDSEQRDTLIDNRDQAADDMFVLGVEALLNEIAANITSYIGPQLLDFNFGTDVYPEFRFGKIADSTRDILKDVFTTIMKGTIVPTPEFVREVEKKMAERLALDINYEELPDPSAPPEPAEATGGAPNLGPPNPPAPPDTSNDNAAADQAAQTLSDILRELT